MHTFHHDGNNHEQSFTIAPASGPDELGADFDPIFGYPTAPSVTPEEIQAEIAKRVAAFNSKMPVFGDTFTPLIDEGQLPPDLRSDFSDNWYNP